VLAAEDLIELIRELNRTPDVEAIVLKINSPGGSVIGSDLIYQELLLTQKPIVVLFDEIGASGAYYLSMSADLIVANRNSLVGSIGVISTFPNLEGLLTDAGIQVTVIASGEAKDFGSLFRAMTPEERRYWQGVIDEIYAEFVAIVASGRGLPEAEVIALADGRVYTGQRALEAGLIDLLGGEADAIREAAQLAGIAGEPRVVRYISGLGIFSLLGQTFGSGFVRTALPEEILHWFIAPQLEYRWLP